MNCSLPGSGIDVDAIVPITRCGNRPRSWAPSSEASSLASRGDSTISSGPGSRSTPGGTGEFGPLGNMYSE